MFNEFNNLETDLLEMVELNSTLDNYDIIEEANINTKDISAPHKGKSNYRYIMITGSGISSHNGRMKVSKPGIKITRNTSHKDYISIYRKDNNTIYYEGDLKEIKMNELEYRYYVDLFIRNEALIQLVKIGGGKYDDYVDSALIDDENNRLNGLIINRNISNGDAEVYDASGKLLYRKNIRGEII